MAIVRCREVFEMALQRESQAFLEAGFDVDVIMLQEPDGEPCVTERDGVTVHRLRGAKSRGSKAEYLVNYGSFLLRAGRALLTQHRRRPFSLVHVLTMPDFLVFCAAPLRRRGVRVSLFMKEPTPELGYTLYGSRFIERTLALAERAAIRSADVVFTVTKELREAYIERGADPGKVHVVLNTPAEGLFASPPSRATSDSDDRFVLVSHGTIEERWGHEVMVEAVDLVRDRIPEVELRLTGSGSYVEEMMRLVAERGLGDHVTYLGWIDFEDVVAEVAAADAGIVAQLASPYSHLVQTNKMYEYIMVDTPCIASRLRATDAAFDDDELLFFEPDNARSLADAIVRLYESPELARQLTANARARYEAGYRWVDQKPVLIEHATEGLDMPPRLSRP